MLLFQLKWLSVGACGQDPKPVGIYEYANKIEFHSGEVPLFETLTACHPFKAAEIISERKNHTYAYKLPNKHPRFVSTLKSRIGNSRLFIRDSSSYAKGISTTCVKLLSGSWHTRNNTNGCSC